MDSALFKIKARRVLRRSPRVAWREFHEALMNRGQLISFALAVLATWILIRTGRGSVSAEVAEWTAAIQAFCIVAIGWAVLCLIRAPFVVVRDDRRSGTWLGRKMIYHSPILVCACPWPANQGGRQVRVDFVDAEPDSIVEYSAEIHPEVDRKAIYFREQVPPWLRKHLFWPGSKEAVTEASLREWANAGTFAGHGIVPLDGHAAHLSVSVVLPQEIDHAIVRVYMHSFEVRPAQGSLQ